jgi:hypothetical protein
MCPVVVACTGIQHHHDVDEPDTVAERVATGDLSELILMLFLSLSRGVLAATLKKSWSFFVPTQRCAGRRTGTARYWSAVFNRLASWRPSRKDSHGPQHRRFAYHDQPRNGQWDANG